MTVRKPGSYDQLKLPFPPSENLTPSSVEHYIEGHLLLDPINREVVERYAETHPEIDLNSGRFIDERRFFKGGLAWEATSTICVPFDVDDDPLAASETLRQLNDGAKLETFEVALGVNGDWPGGDNPLEWLTDKELQHEIGRQRTQYERLTKHLESVRGKLFPDLMLRTFLTHLPERNMNKVWGRILESVITESIIMGRDPAYPIIRFDADSTGIRRKTVPTMAEAIRDGEAHLVKARTLFGYRTRSTSAATYGLDLLEPKERQTEAVARIYALAKEMIEAQLEDTEERSYNEESGSGARLINWMHVLTIARMNDPEHLSDDGENRIFLEIAKVALNKEIAPIKYVAPNEATHSTSDRRMRELAAAVPPWLIPIKEEGPDYQTYVKMKQTENGIPRPQLRTVQDVMAMIGIMLMRQEKVCGRTVHLPILAKSKLASIINLGKFHTGGRPLSAYTDWVSEARQLGAARLREIKKASRQK